MEDININNRLRKEVTKVLSSLDKGVLHKMQGDMHRCSVKCCDNTTASTEDVERCRQTCEMPLERAFKNMHQELMSFWNGVNRGMVDCQVREDFEVCAKKCADEHINKLPELSKRLEAAIKNM